MKKIFALFPIVNFDGDVAICSTRAFGHSNEWGVELAYIILIDCDPFLLLKALPL